MEEGMEGENGRKRNTKIEDGEGGRTKKKKRKGGGGRMTNKEDMGEGGGRRRRSRAIDKKNDKEGGIMRMKKN